MKKRTFALFFGLIAFGINAHAQFFLGGSMGISYRHDRFSLALKPNLGYEFNERWAVGLGIGVDYLNEEFYGNVNPYIRFNCWNNSKIFFDLKASADVLFNTENVSTLAGLKPSLRYAINDHWQIAADVAVLGVDIYDGVCKPAFVFATSNTELTFLYKF